MRTRLFCAVLLLSCACIKRIAPGPGETRTTLPGTPLAFGAPQELPQGTTIHWQFGDGTPEQVGAQVTHSFPRAGSYAVVESVQDRDGEKRSATVQVQVTPRPPQAAVPADARSALMLERPWARFAVQRKAAQRVGLGELFDETDHEFSELFGFAAGDPKAVEANGIDTDAGIALYTVPQDIEALVACAGMSDPDKAIASLQHLLAHDRGGPFALHDAKLADGTPVTVGERASGAEKIAYLTHLGYLYLRVPGASDPLLALASAAALKPEAGLVGAPQYNKLIAKVGGSGDALFYSAGLEGDAVSSRFANQVGASAFSVNVGNDAVKVQGFALPRNLSGQAIVDAFTPAGPPPDFAALLPVGAAFFAKASGAPAIIWHEFARAIGNESYGALRERLHEALGSDVDALIPAFTGNGAVALYLDAQSLIEALLGEQVASLDRSTFLTVSELKPGADGPLRAALDHAAHDNGGGKAVRGGTFWMLSDALQVAIRGNMMFAAVGGAPELESPEEGNRVERGRDGEHGGEKADKAAAKRPAPAKKTPPRNVPPPEPTANEVGPLAAVLFAADGAPSLSRQLKDVELPLSTPTAQLLWIDVRGTVARLQSAADDQGGVVGVALHRLSDRVRGLRDVLVDARPDQDGINATITLRFMPESAAPAK